MYLQEAVEGSGCDQWVGLHVEDPGKPRPPVLQAVGVSPLRRELRSLQYGSVESHHSAHPL